MISAARATNNSLLKCGCGIALGECLAPGCPIWLGDPYGRQPWSEGWALSAYSGAVQHDTRMGELVHIAKYGERSYSDRLQAADEAAERVMAFINYLGDSNFRFEACITAPSHGAITLNLATHLCEQIAVGFGVLNLSHLLSERPGVEPMKSISDPRVRIRTLDEAVAFDSSRIARAPRAVLIVDDVFESGATATVMARKLKAAWPETRMEVMTATHRSCKRIGLSW